MPDPPPSNLPTLGLLLAGTGLLFMVEQGIALVSAEAYRAVNRARRARRFAVLGPAGLVVFSWGLLCLYFSVPPHHPAQYCLLLLALPFLPKGTAMLFFSARLARVSKRVQASDPARRWRVFGGLLFGGVLITWGLWLWGQTR